MAYRSFGVILADIIQATKGTANSSALRRALRYLFAKPERLSAQTCCRARTQAACLNSSDRRAARHCNGSPPAQAPLRFAIFQKLAAVPRWHRSLRLIPSLVARNWSRELQALGHTERLIPRACVKPCVKQQRTMPPLIFFQLTQARNHWDSCNCIPGSLDVC